MTANFRRLSETSTTYVDESKPKEVTLGKFVICPDSKLGSGAFSSVYLCKDKAGNKAAAKIMSKHTKRSEQIIKVAKSEVKILQKIKHPNIVGLLGSYESENNYYILFEYCEGKTLKEILHQQRSMDIQSVLHIITSIISVMGYMLEKKIMHRDIKPDNIKFFKGKVTLIDFGFACDLPNGEKTFLQ